MSRIRIAATFDKSRDSDATLTTNMMLKEIWEVKAREESPLQPTNQNETCPNKTLALPQFMNV